MQFIYKIVISFIFVVTFLQNVKAANYIEKKIVLYNKKNNENIYLKDILPKKYFSALNDEKNIILEVTNLSDEDKIYISVINPTLDKMNIFSGNKKDTLGDFLIYKNRKERFYNYVFVLDCKKNETKNVSIKIHAQYEPINFRINVSTENKFIKISNNDNIFLGFFLGIYFLYIILLICFFVFTKSKYFIVYISLITSVLFLIFIYSGVGYQYIWAFSTTIPKVIIPLTIAIYFFLHSYFIRIFLNINTQYYTIDLFFKAINMLAVLFFSLYFFLIVFIDNAIKILNVYYLIILFFTVFYGLLISILCFYIYKKQPQKEVIWVSVANALHFLNILIFINIITGKISFLFPISNFYFFSSNLFISHFVLFIVFVEFLLISGFITFRFHNLIRQNNLSKKRLEFLQSRNFNNFLAGEEDERAYITNKIDKTILQDIHEIEKNIIDFSTIINDLKINNILNSINSTKVDLNNITNNYVAKDIENINYINLIYTVTNKFSLNLIIDITFQNITEKFILPQFTSSNIYRIIQELLNNISKHSKAKNVEIKSILETKKLIILINDDGIGMNINEIDKSKSGLGIVNILSRIENLNGKIRFESNQNIGTFVEIILNTTD